MAYHLHSSAVATTPRVSLFLKNWHRHISSFLRHSLTVLPPSPDTPGICLSTPLRLQGAIQCRRTAKHFCSNCQCGPQCSNKRGQKDWTSEANQTTVIFTCWSRVKSNWTICCTGAVVVLCVFLLSPECIFTRLYERFELDCCVVVSPLIEFKMHLSMLLNVQRRGLLLLLFKRRHTSGHVVLRRCNSLPISCFCASQTSENGCLNLFQKYD